MKHACRAQLKGRIEHEARSTFSKILINHKIHSDSKAWEGQEQAFLVVVIVVFNLLLLFFFPCLLSFLIPKYFLSNISVFS